MVNPTQRWKLTALALLGLTVFSSLSLQAQTETVIPQEFTGGMRNPLMGFREGQRSGTPGQKNLASQAAGKLADLSAHPYCVLVRDYIHYNVLEDSVGDTVQKIKDYSNSAWANYETKNIKVIPRVILLYTAGQTPPQDYWPNDLTDGDWTSQAVRDRVVAMVRKMGEAWNDDPRVAWVHVGLIGQWGEQESPVGIDQDLGGGVTWAKILQPVFKEAFPNKIVLVRSPEKWADDYDVGMYWDTYSANGKMNEPVDEWGRVKYNNKVPREVYKKSVVEGEVAYGPQFAIPAQMGVDENATMQDVNFRQFFMDTVRSVHGTTVGIEYDPRIAENTIGASEVQKVFGYRFLLKEFTFEKRVEPGETLDFSAKVVNDGSAPTYANWPLSVVLMDEVTKEIVWTSPAVPDVDITQWMPGTNYQWTFEDGGLGTGARTYANPAPINQVNGTVVIPANLAAGSYLVGLSILDPTTGKPGIFFSVTNFLQASNTQPLGRLGIGADANSNNITFDPFDFKNDTRRYNLTPVESVVSVSATDHHAGESGDTGTFTFKRTGTHGTSAPLTVNYTLSGTATEGADFQSLGGTVTIPAGQSSVTKTVTVLDDAVLEGKERAILRLSSSPAYTIGWPGNSTVLIADNEPEPLPWVEPFTYADGTSLNVGAPSWTATPATVGHSVLSNQMSISGIASEAVFKTGAIDISSGAVTVSLTVIGNGTDSGTDGDYLRLYKKVDGWPEVLIGSANGQPTSSTWTATINGGNQLELIIKSRVNQKNENYRFDDLSVQLNGRPSLPNVTISATDAIASEPANHGMFTIARSGSTSVALTVNIAVGGTAGNGTDYLGIGTTVTIPAGQTSMTQQVGVIDDNTFEGDETVIVTLQNNPAYTIESSNSATVTLTDNEVLPNVSVIGEWTQGTQRALAPGGNRVLVVMVMGEHNTSDFSATTVTYGGQVMTKQAERILGTTFRTYSSIFTLNASGLNAAASEEIAVSWSSAPAGFDVYSVLLGNVDHTNPVGQIATNSLSGTAITTTALATAEGDRVIFAGATAGNNIQTANNGFTKQFESNAGWGDGVGGDKIGIGAAETPGFTQSTSGRMVICAMVVRRANASTAPTYGTWPLLSTLPADRRGALHRNGPLDLPNLLAYAMHLDPLTATAADLPMFSDDVASAGPVKIRYRRAKNLSDVILTPMTSTTLQDWQPANVLQSSRVMDGGEWELLEISLPDPPAGRLFFNMQAQQTP